ncbi:hypothetical protein QQ045_002422 [Rhodiola kirilowii]
MEELCLIAWSKMEVLVVSVTHASLALIAQSSWMIVFQMLTDSLQWRSIVLGAVWMDHAESSAILTSGWHRMSYIYPYHVFTSPELQRKILAVHAIVGNAYTDNRFFIFGAGSTQLLNAAVYALSPDQNSSDPPARVVVSAPFYRTMCIQLC